MRSWSATLGLDRNAGKEGEPDASLPAAPERKQPEQGIALALGGGAARGWAHIGILKAFDEAGIPIDMIAGTSIGALVGGCYLAGKLPELEEFALSLTRRRIFGLLDFRFGGSGLLAGMRLTNRMREHLEGLNIEDLPKPFVCVASELRTGHEVWLTRGSLITAIRASYALPGVFAPVICNGRMLVDGALVNPVPVSVCRAYEQPIVVGINLNNHIFGRAAVIRHSAEAAESLDPPDRDSELLLPTPEAIAHVPDRSPKPMGLLGVMIESFNIIQDRITRARLAGDPPDLTLQLKLGDLGLAEFHRAAEAIEIGYTTGKAYAPEIMHMLEMVS